MDYIVVTSGALYLDIDAYACCVAMKELLRLKGQNAIAYSSAVCNYSVCQSLTQEGEIIKVLPEGFLRKECKYILVDVSDPKYIEKSISIEKVIGIYDHHIGFEEYWESRIRDKSHIEFIGAAASLIFQEWKVSGLFEKMKRSTALLLIAAILDNTLNLTSSNTSAIDIDAFNELCKKEAVDEKWCSLYFSEVQKNIECDLKNALFNDIKVIRDNDILPSNFGQICIWDAKNILNKIVNIRSWFNTAFESWIINIMDIKNHCSYLVCDDVMCQEKIKNIFDVHFDKGVAKTVKPYLRKEILKRVNESI